MHPKERQSLIKAIESIEGLLNEERKLFMALHDRAQKVAKAHTWVFTFGIRRGLKGLAGESFTFISNLKDKLNLLDKAKESIRSKVAIDPATLSILSSVLIAKSVLSFSAHLVDTSKQLFSTMRWVLNKPISANAHKEFEFMIEQMEKIFEINHQVYKKLNKLTDKMKSAEPDPERDAAIKALDAVKKRLMPGSWFNKKISSVAKKMSDEAKRVNFARTTNEQEDKALRKASYDKPLFKYLNDVEKEVNRAGKTLSIIKSRLSKVSALNPYIRTRGIHRVIDKALGNRFTFGQSLRNKTNKLHKLEKIMYRKAYSDAATSFLIEQGVGKILDESLKHIQINAINASGTMLEPAIDTLTKNKRIYRAFHWLVNKPISNDAKKEMELLADAADVVLEIPESISKSANKALKALENTEDGPDKKYIQKTLEDIIKGTGEESLFHEQIQKVKEKIEKEAFRLGKRGWKIK